MAQATTTAAVKAQLEITDTDDDPYIGQLITDCTDWIEAYCRRWVCPRAEATYLVDTAAGGVIDVRRWGVRTIASLGIADSNQPDSGGSYDAITAYVLRPAAIDRDEGMPATTIVLLDDSLSSSINGARIVMTAGPETTPARIARVAVDAVAAAFQARRAGGSGVIGAQASPVVEWAKYFATGSPQLSTLDELAGVIGIG